MPSRQRLRSSTPRRRPLRSHRGSPRMSRRGLRARGSFDARIDIMSRSRPARHRTCGTRVRKFRASPVPSFDDIARLNGQRPPSPKTKRRSNGEVDGEVAIDHIGAMRNVTVPLSLVHLLGRPKPTSATPRGKASATLRPASRRHGESKPVSYAPRKKPVVRSFSHLRPAADLCDTGQAISRAAPTASIATASGIIAAAARARAPTDREPPPRDSLAAQIISAARRGIRL